MSNSTGERTSIPVAITIMDREYTVGCEPSEKDDLLEAAATLDRKMREIRGANRMAAVDRVMILAALNCVSEMQALQRQQQGRDAEISRLLTSLNDKLDAHSLQGDLGV